MEIADEGASKIGRNRTEGGATRPTVTDTREEEKRTDEALRRCFGGDV